MSEYTLPPGLAAEQQLLALMSALLDPLEHAAQTMQELAPTLVKSCYVEENPHYRTSVITFVAN